MAFMQPEVYETDYLEIDGPMGGEVIPCNVVDFHPTDEQNEVPPRIDSRSRQSFATIAKTSEPSRSSASTVG